MTSSFRARVLVLGSLTAGLMAACSAVVNHGFDTTTTGSGGAGNSAATSAQVGTATGTGGQIFMFPDSGDDSPGCDAKCSTDFHTVLDCNGGVVQMCTGLEGCDLSLGACGNACQAAVNNKQSVGCEYYATDMDQYDQDACFAAFVANTWDTPAHLVVDYGGNQLNPAMFAFIPSGTGPSLTYTPYDPSVGIPPGEVVILFLGGSDSSQVPCPEPSAMQTGAQIFQTSGIGASFHITTDVPVVAYEINPYGGGSAAVTGASLLLPTSVWDTNYVAVTVSPNDIAPPSMNIIAYKDNTHVTMLPVVSVDGGGGLAPGPANTPYVFTLHKGQQAQFTQAGDLSGSVIQSDNAIGFMAGQGCMRAPFGVAYCDHGEQMIPPIKALGNEYVGVMFRPRVVGDEAIWHLVGVIDGTQLTYSSSVGGPATVNAAQAVDFITDQPFTVQSQDIAHPFMLFTYMSGSQWKPGMDGYGDPDFVLSVPPQQYLSEYVFFTDPTYPETNLVIVREATSGMFQDVTLDCAGVLSGWQPVGAYEWTRIDLISHNFQNQGNCSTGRHDIKSAGRFGLWVWGWGTPETSSFTANVSYGYPGGMNVAPINTVIIPPIPN